MSSVQAEFIGVVRAAPKEGQMLLASIFAPKTTLTKSVVEREFMQQCQSGEKVGTFKKTATINGQPSKIFVTYDLKTQCFVGCAANENFAERLGFDTCRAATQTLQQHGLDKVAAAKPLSLNSPLREAMVKVMGGATGDKLQSTQNKVDQTKEKMQDNMQKMVQNYDNLQDLDAKMDDVDFEANKFKQDAKTLKWHEMKQFWFTIGIVAFVILIIIIALIIHFS